MTENGCIHTLKSGQRITITDPTGKKRSFQVTIGDALLNGQTDQVWLKHESNDHTEYLRKDPIEPRSIGTALFASLNDVADTLASQRYYIG